MAVKVYRILAGDLDGAIRELGYNANVYRPADIRREVYRILIGDIRGGETGWPVDTGYSQSAFFQRDGELWNEAPYAKALENGKRRGGRTAARFNFISDYLGNELSNIVQTALDLIGARPRSEEEERRSGFSLAAVAFRGLNVGFALGNQRGGYLALSRDNRRLLRTFRPGRFLTDPLDSRPARER